MKTLRYRFLYTVSVITTGLALLSFWAGLVMSILSACKVIATPLWVVVLIWMAVLIVFVILTALFYNLADTAEQAARRDRR